MPTVLCWRKVIATNALSTCSIERAAAYAELPYRIDTSGRTVAEVAEEVVRLAESGLGGVLRLPVTLPDGRGYDVLLGSGTLADLPALLPSVNLRGGLSLSATNMWRRPGDQPWSTPLPPAAVPATFIVLPAGEIHKNLATMARLYDELVVSGLDRGGLILGLGGGVVGDMAGFAAATYLRGVRLVQVPTSLLAMVDASVGGKTGVDLPQGKNLVGAFKQPELVVVDPGVLTTLPPVEFRNGLAEVVKHGIIADPDLFVQLLGAGPESLQSMLARALRVKIGIVERDPFERGERALLNLGHTFAHAFEQLSHYEVPHGQAVAVGLVAAGKLAFLRGECSAQVAGRIEEAVGHLGLPTRLRGLRPAAALAAMATDKKRLDGRLRFVLPHDIGEVAIASDVSEGQALAALEAVLA